MRRVVIDLQQRRAGGDREFERLLVANETTRAANELHPGIRRFCAGHERILRGTRSVHRNVRIAILVGIQPSGHLLRAIRISVISFLNDVAAIVLRCHSNSDREQAQRSHKLHFYLFYRSTTEEPSGEFCWVAPHGACLSTRFG